MGRNPLPLKDSFSSGIIILLILVFLALVFFLPYGIVLFTGLGGASGLKSGPVIQILSSPYYRGILKYTFYQAFLSTLFALLLGFPGAYLLARVPLKGKGIIKAVCTVPFVLPSILVVLGFVLFFGNNGILNTGLMRVFSLENPPLRILYSLKAIILAHAFYNFPICLRLVSSAWERTPKRLLWASMSLGAGRVRSFFTVTLPHLLPSLTAAALLIFLYCFNSFAVILVLGGGPKYTTVEVEIYRLARMNLDFERASGLSLLATLISLGLTVLYLILSRREAGLIHGEFRSEPVPVKPLGRALLILYSLLIILIIFAPLASVALRSFSGSGNPLSQSAVTLRWYRALFSPSPTGGGNILLSSLGTSLALALASGLLAGVIGTAAAYLGIKKRACSFILPLCLFPLGVSSLILGLGFTRIYASKGEGFALLFLLFIHTVLSLPFVSQSVSSAVKGLPGSLRNTARSLGAGRYRAFFTVELPMLKPAILAGISFACAISLGEFQAALLLLTGESVTLPIALYRLIAAYNFNGACALGTILILFCTLLFLFILQFEKQEAR